MLFKKFFTYFKYGYLTNSICINIFSQSLSFYSLSKQILFFTLMNPSLSIISSCLQRPLILGCLISLFCSLLSLYFCVLCFGLWSELIYVREVWAMALVQSSSRASVEICSSLFPQPRPIQLLTIKDIFSILCQCFWFLEIQVFLILDIYIHTHILPTYFETVLYAVIMLDAFHHATQFSTLFTCKQERNYTFN